MIYKNISATSKVFYGKTFHPGEEHEVPGYINAPGFIRLSKLSKPQSQLQSNGTKKVDKKSKDIKQEEVLDGSNSNQ